MTGTPTAAERIGAAVGGLVEEVFGTVAEVRAAALQSLREADGAERATAEFPGLAEPLQALVRQPGRLASGLGLMVAPSPALDLRVQLHWWQLDPVSGVVRELDPDLRPDSVGFYDYPTAPWFEVPRRTGERHVVGPHVDVHGTGQYLLTFTAPVLVHGTFLGVAGVDVAVSRFEAHLLHRLGTTSEPFCLVNDDDRVVLSTSPWWLVGSLLRGHPSAGTPLPGTPVPGAPWRLTLLDDDGRPRAA
jgi:hypothetical protein